MKMQRKQFRIGELAEKLEVERFVIRFWEKEFLLKPTRSQGGQRFYEEKDLKRFQRIKQLLYEEGFTISGAKKQLEQKKVRGQANIIASKKTTMEPAAVPVKTSRETDLEKQIIHLQEQLKKLRTIL